MNSAPRIIWLCTKTPGVPTVYGPTRMCVPNETILAAGSYEAMTAAARLFNNDCLRELQEAKR
jgi:hypothetical protein